MAKARTHHPHHHHHKQKPKGFGIIRRLADYDHRLTQTLAISANKHSPFYQLRPLWKLIEISGHGIPWLLIPCAALVLIQDHPYAVELIVNLIFALIMDLITVVLLKVSVKRARPSHNRMDMFATISLDQYSFPSGHATRAALLSYFAHELVPLTPDRSFLIWSWSAIVACSRVFLGRHYASDALIGYLIGILEFLWFIQVGWIEQEKCLVISEFMQRFNYFQSYLA